MTTPTPVPIPWHWLCLAGEFAFWRNGARLLLTSRTWCPDDDHDESGDPYQTDIGSGRVVIVNVEGTTWYSLEGEHGAIPGEVVDRLIDMDRVTPEQAEHVRRVVDRLWDYYAPRRFVSATHAAVKCEPVPDLPDCTEALVVVVPLPRAVIEAHVRGMIEDGYRESTTIEAVVMAGCLRLHGQPEGQALAMGVSWANRCLDHRLRRWTEGICETGEYSRARDLVQTVINARVTRCNRSS